MPLVSWLLHKSEIQFWGVTVVGVAKLRKPALGRHRSYRDTSVFSKNTLNIDVLMQILFGHGTTMTALDIIPQL